jgi:hypothetical protein
MGFGDYDQFGDCDMACGEVKKNLKLIYAVWILESIYWMQYGWEMNQNYMIPMCIAISYVYVFVKGYLFHDMVSYVAILTHCMEGSIYHSLLSISMCFGHLLCLWWMYPILG